MLFTQNSVKLKLHKFPASLCYKFLTSLCHFHGTKVTQISVILKLHTNSLLHCYFRKIKITQIPCFVMLFPWNQSYTNFCEIKITQIS